MQIVTANFLAAIQTSFTMVVQADVYFQQTYVVTVPITDGAITVDRSSDVRRSGTATIGDKTFWPTFANSALAPYGAEMNLKAGIIYANGTKEMVSLGWFTVENVSIEAAGGLPIVQLYDRAQVLKRDPFLWPKSPGTQSFAALIPAYLQGAASYLTVSLDGSLSTALSGQCPGGTAFDDRSGAIQQMAQWAGADAYFDVFGVMQVKPTPTLFGLTDSQKAAKSVWTISAGAGGILTQAQRTVGRTDVANGVVVRGTTTGSTTAPEGYAFDTDTRSPTYWGPAPANAASGVQAYSTPFGQQGIVVQNDLITTNAQAGAAAQVELNKRLGLARTVNLTAVPNFALEAGDIFKVIYADGTFEYHIVNSMSIPLAPTGQFTASTLSQTYQLSSGQ